MKAEHHTPGVSRSALYSAAVAEFLARHTESEVTARLDRLYASESSALEPAIQRAQRWSLEPEAWQAG